MAQNIEIPVVHCAHDPFSLLLAVEAETSDQAVKLFQAYLDAQTDQEDEEYQMALDISDEDDAPDRDDYTYDFDADDVEELDNPDRWRYTPSAEVQMISSGANG